MKTEPTPENRALVKQILDDYDNSGVDWGDYISSHIDGALLAKGQATGTLNVAAAAVELGFRP